MKKIIIIILLIALTSCSTTPKTLQYPDKALHIDEYSIVPVKRLDWAGPAYYRYNVYKNRRYEGYATLSDSCLLRFEENRQRFVDFNICDATGRLYTDSKAPVDVKAVDSVLVSGRNGSALRLTKREILKYTRMWNKAQPNGLYRMGKGYDYELTIYAGGAARQFKVLNDYITEDGSWSYRFKWNTFFEKRREMLTNNQ